LTVPLDWSRPIGEKNRIHLSVMRRKASVSAEKGTLVINPGGPGTPGVDVSQFTDFGGEIAKYYDVVSFNTRGTNADNMLLCSRTLADTIEASSVWPITSQEVFDDRKLLSRNLEDDCRRRSTPDVLVKYVDTFSTVKDLEALRVALVGDGDLNFYGMSYGTLIAQRYVQEYPQNVGKFVTDSNMDYSVDAQRWFGDPAEAMQDIIDSFVAACASEKACYELLGDGANSDGAVRKFVDQLMRHAALGELANAASIWTQPALIKMIGDRMSNRDGWLALASSLSALDKQAAPAVSKPNIPSSSNLIWGNGERNFVTQATMCHDWDLANFDYATWSNLHESAKTTNVPSVPKADTRALYCLGWTGPAGKPAPPFLPGNAQPMLIINSRYDGATGYNWATSVANMFDDKAVLLTYDGSGHIDIGRNSCIDAAVAAYLVDDVVPAKDAHCPAKML
jgi:pimeloyl-ACP methyl ester carboxylesterase